MSTGIFFNRYFWHGGILFDTKKIFFHIIKTAMWHGDMAFHMVPMLIISHSIH
jgi:hypothetical protein